MKLTDVINTEYENCSPVSILKNYSENDSAIFEKLRDEYETFLSKYAFKGYELPCYLTWRQSLHSHFSKDPWTSAHITQLSILLKDYEEENYFEYTGYFFSKIIDIHFENQKKMMKNVSQEYTIVTNHLERNIASLCTENQANVIVDGNVGYHFCLGMKGGIVILKGNAGDYACDGMRNGIVRITGNTESRAGYYLKEGKIIIEGNTEYCTGEYAQGGVIHILGNTSHNCGLRLDGGTILVEGNCGEQLGDCMKNGTITVNGKTEKNAGFLMKGGTINLNQDKETIILADQTENTGRIFAQGKQIFPSEDE